MLERYKNIVIPPERQTKISFDPEPHKYYDDNGIDYTSVTTLIGKYEYEFNQKYWSMYTALRDSGVKVRPDGKKGMRAPCKFIIIDGIPRSLTSLYDDPYNTYAVKDVVDKWKDLTAIACARGNKIHDGLERDINVSKGDYKGDTNKAIRPRISLEGEMLVIKTEHDLNITGLHLRQPKIYAFLLKYVKEGCTLYAEKRIYSTSYQIAGMIDVLIVKGKYFAILDWKTNKALMVFKSGYFKKIKDGSGNFVKSGHFIETNDTLKYPLDKVPDCKGMKYTMQLSLYARVMELWGYTLVRNGLTICHMRPEMEPIFIPVKYLKEDVDNMLLHHYVETIQKENVQRQIMDILGS